jgi:mandelamide amidase
MHTSLQQTHHDHLANPASAVTAVFDRVEKASAELGAFISIADRNAVDPQHLHGPLAGVPFAVKDNIDTSDLPTTAGSALLADHRPAVTARVVQQLMSAGGYMVGKTNMHELGMGITSNNRTYGPVRNLFDTSRSAGGSSGGSAAAVASGAVPFALGTDTGGSVRIPASFCGITGFRPTVGRYSDAGLVKLSWTRDTVGLLARSAAEIVLVDDVLTGGHAQARPQRESLRLGVPADMYEDLAAEIEEGVRAALGRLRGAGVDLVPVDLGSFREDCMRAGTPIVFYEQERTLSRYLQGVRDGRLGLADLAEASPSPDVRAQLELMLAEPVTAENYGAGLGLRDRLRRRMTEGFRQHGLGGLIYPTCIALPPVIGDDITIKHNGRDQGTLLTIVANATVSAALGTPSISLPAGRTRTGLPVGMTLEGLPGDDGRLLDAARAIEPALLANDLPAGGSRGTVSDRMS